MHGEVGIRQGAACGAAYGKMQASVLSAHNQVRVRSARRRTGCDGTSTGRWYCGSGKALYRRRIERHRRTRSRLECRTRPNHDRGPPGAPKLDEHETQQRMEEDEKHWTKTLDGEATCSQSWCFSHCWDTCVLDACVVDAA